MNPSLIVFDLDYTLWDAGETWCDHLNPPFENTAAGPIDSDGRLVRLYDDVREILDWCQQENISMALASRTYEPSWAGKLISMLGIADLFDYKEIFPASKVTHFTNLHEASGIPLNKMLFFDDEMRNIYEVGRMGVTAVFVENGMTMELFEEGLKKWESKQ